MAKEYIKKIRKVEIEWNDSYSRTQTWYDLNFLTSNKQNEFIKSIGYLIKKTKKQVMIAQSLHFEEEYPTKGGHIFEIPTGCIKRIKYL